MRRTAVFAAMLISGGLLLFPRIPLLLIILVICAFYNSPVRLLRREFSLIWLLLALVGALAPFAGESLQLQWMAIRYANFLAGLALLLLYVDERPGTLAADLLPVLRLFAIQALLTPIFALLLPTMFSVLEIADTQYRTFFLIFTYHEFIEGVTFFKRPDGFFFEPGVLQMYLNVFLFIVLFVAKFNWRDFSLAVGGVVATQSTTGAAIMLLLLIAAYLRRIQFAGLRERLLVFLFVPALLVVPVYYVYQNVNSKLYGVEQGSFWARAYDLKAGLAVVAQQPITGIGFDYNRYFELAQQAGVSAIGLSAANVTERANSNGIVTLFYSVGIPLALVFLSGLMRQRFFRPKILLTMLMLLSLSSESLFFTPFVLMLSFSGLLIAPATGRSRKTAPPPMARLARG